MSGSVCIKLILTKISLGGSALNDYRNGLLLIKDVNSSKILEA